MNLDFTKLTATATIRGFTIFYRGEEVYTYTGVNGNGQNWRLDRGLIRHYQRQASDIMHAIKMNRGRRCIIEAITTVEERQ